MLRHTGITHQVLYRYVTLGLIEPARVTGTGQRWFRPSAVSLIRLIQSLNRSGYTLRSLREIFFKQERVQAAGKRDEPPLEVPQVGAAFRSE